MTKVLIVSPYAKDANSYYRCMGPWSYLSKQNREVTIALAQDAVGVQGVAWDTVGQFDAVFMHRPCRPDDLTILRVAKNLGIPVWVDYDDWLFDVPYWNPTAGIYNNAGLQNAISICLAAADLVSVSTSALYDKIRLVNKNVVILPNCYRSDLYRYREKNPPQRAWEFAWRGTNTHDADLMSVAEGFERLPGKVTFYGGPFWALLQRMKPGSFDVVPAQDPFLYMKNLYRAAPKVMLVPLVDNFFNRVKSNIAYQEALHAGALCVAPDLPEWKRTGVVSYEPGNAESFLSAANQAMSMSDKQHAEAVEAGWQDMLRLYDAPYVNQIRMDCLKAITASDFEQNRRDPFDDLLGLWARGVLTQKQLIPNGVSSTALKKAGIE